MLAKDAQGDLVVKIADFGLSAVLPNKAEKYMGQKKERMPIRWLAPETLRDATYSAKTVVFSYSILLWEVCGGGTGKGRYS